MKDNDPPREPARYVAPLTVQEAVELLEKGKRLYDALGPPCERCSGSRAGQPRGESDSDCLGESQVAYP